MALLKDEGVYKGDSVYTSSDHNFDDKATFRFAADLVEAHWGAPPPALEFVDFGCATGSFQRLLAKRFHGSIFLGVDITPSFIAAAEAPRSVFEVGDLRTFPATRRWDVVTFLGTFGMFDDFKVPLARLLQFVNPGGIVIADGGFNAKGYEVEIRFRRRVDDDEAPDWEFGFNQVSRTAGPAWLTKQGLDHEFSEMAFPVDLPPTSGPHLRSYTQRLEDGSRIVMNDLNLVLPHVFLTIRP